MSTLRVLDHTGDTEVEWIVEDEVALEAAQKLFNNMIKMGYLAYAIQSLPAETAQDTLVEVAEKPKSVKVPKTILYEFDPTALEIVMTPMLRGG